MTRVVVIGMGRFGSACARRFYDKGAEVLAIDRSQAVIQRATDTVTAAIACDATERGNLTAYDVGDMDVAVVAMASNFEASVLVTLHCRELGVPLVVAKALNPMQSRVLQEVGAHQVVMPEEEMGERLADHILGQNIVDFVELPTGYSLRRLPVPAAWTGKSLADLELLSSERLNLVQIVRAGEGIDEDRFLPLPHGTTVLEAGDLMDVIGQDEILEALESA
jgi:trk system potassium uptake protein TrkA